MAFNEGITRYRKKKWMDELTALITAGSAKMALYSTTTGLDATTDPATPLTYTATGELTSSATGYTAGGYVLTGATLAASGNAYNLTFANVVTGSGAIAAGTYGAIIYDITDSNRVVAVLTVTVTQASSGGAMTISAPANCLYLS